MKRTTLLLSVLAFSLSMQAQLPRDAASAEHAATRRKADAAGQLHALARCSGSTALTPPVTRTGTISLSSCTDVIGIREDVYSVTVAAGQTLDVDFSSRDFDTLLTITKGASVPLPTNRISFLDFGLSGESRVTAHQTFTSGGTVLIEAQSLWSIDPSAPGAPWSGAYTITVTLSGTSTPSTPANAQIVPIVGHVAGAGGSAFRSDLKLYNGSSSTVTGRLVFTPRNQSRSASDPSVAFNVPPFGVRFFEDVYLQGYPGGSGAARLTILPDSATAAALVVDTSTYTATADGGELAQSPTVSTASDYYASGKKLVGLLGKGSERSNVFVMTGATDVTIQWRLRDSNGAGTQTVTRTYAKDSTFQMSVPDITGAAPAPNSSLEATIQSGSARIALSPVNNVSNQGRWTDFKVAP